MKIIYYHLQKNNNRPVHKLTETEFLFVLSITSLLIRLTYYKGKEAYQSTLYVQ